jgi:hypothetical protein
MGIEKLHVATTQYAQSITLECNFPTVKLEKGHIVAGRSEL